MYKALGKVTTTDDGVRLVFSRDLSRLWNWFFLKETGMIFDLPMRPSKITLWNKNFSYQKKPDINKFRGRKLMVEFDPSKAIHLVSRKGYWVHWLNVEDENLWNLIKEMGIESNFDRRNRPHLSISNGKYAVKSRVQKKNELLAK